MVYRYKYKPFIGNSIQGTPVELGNGIAPLGTFCWYSGIIGDFRFCDPLSEETPTTAPSVNPATPTTAPTQAPTKKKPCPILPSSQRRRQLPGSPERLLQDVGDPCTWPDCPGIDLAVKTKQAKKGKHVKMAIKVANKAARTSVNNGTLTVVLPAGARYIDSASSPKGQGRAQYDAANNVLRVTDIFVPQKKAIDFLVLLGVSGVSGDSYFFSIYFSDFNRQCTDLYRIEVRLK